MDSQSRGEKVMVKIGIIGTGMLGNAVALHLIKCRYELYVYNRTKSKTTELKEKGANICETPKQVAENVDLLITIIKDADAVKHVAFGDDGIIKANHTGLVVADMSTINPIESKQISQKFKESEIIMLDTPVMGGPNVAITGDLVMMASGPKTAFERFKPIFDAIANKVFYLGENATAHAVKLAMNLQIAMLALALSEGITLMRGANIDPEIFLKILNSTYFKTGMSQNKAFKMIKDQFVPTFTLENLKKDLHTINQTSDALGILLPMSKKAEELYCDAIKNGFGNLDYTGILAYIKEISQSK